MYTGIVSHARLWRMKQFADWFCEQGELPKLARTRDYKQVDIRFTKHSRNARQTFTEIFDMARKKTNDFKWEGYANISIPASHEDALIAFLGDAKEIYSSVNHALLTGYNFSMPRVEEDGQFKVTITCYDKDSPNFGKSLSAWADNWFDAVGVVMYKHFTLSQENWGDSGSKTKRKFG